MRDVRTAATDAWMDLWGKPNGSAPASPPNVQTASPAASAPAPSPAAEPDASAAGAPPPASPLQRAWAGVRDAQAANTAATEQHARAAGSWAGRAMHAVDGLAARAHDAMPDGVRQGFDAAEAARESVAGAVGDAWNWAGNHIGSAAKAADGMARKVGTAVDGAVGHAVASGTDAVRRHVGEDAAEAFRSGADALHGQVRAGVQFQYGVTEGVLAEGGAMVSGVGHLAGEAYRLETDPAAREQAAAALARTAVRVNEDPTGVVAGAAGAAYHAGADWVQGAEDASGHGGLPEYLGNSTGHVAAAVASVVVPGAVTGKFGEAANLAGRAGEATNLAGKAGDIASTAARVEETAAERTVAAARTPAATTREAAGPEARVAQAASETRGATTAGTPEPKPGSPGHLSPSLPVPPPVVRTFGTFEEFAKAANAAEPNSIYKWGSYDWETDASGRVTRAEGKVEVKAFGRNDPKTQLDVGKNTPGRQEGDIGFHLIGDGFNAPTVRVNVVPGNGVSLDGLKSLNLSAYKKFENTVRGLAGRPGADVEIRIEAVYNPGNTTRRPDLFRASYRESGGDWIKRRFPNKPQ